MASLFLPSSGKRFVLSKLLGYRIERTARIGFSIILCRQVVIEDNARIGHFNVIRNLDVLHMEANSLIGHLNMISGFGRGGRYFNHQPDRTSRLLLGAHSAITMRHQIDCSSPVVVGRFTVVAGHYTQILTHSVDLRLNRQHSEPVSIGDYCFLGSNCTLLGGSQLPSYSVLGARALLKTAFSEEWCLYAGVPAKKVHDLPHEWAFFTRTVGHVT